MEPKRVRPGIKKGSPMGTAVESFWNRFCCCLERGWLFHGWVVTVLITPNLNGPMSFSQG